MQAERYVVAVLSPDRVGLLRDITGAVADLGANIDAIDQTVVEGMFSGLLTTTFPRPVDDATVAAALRERLGSGAADVRVRPMPALPGATVGPVDRFVVTAAGRDRPGILAAVMQFLAGQGINVERWSVLREDAYVTYVGEVAVPVQLDIRALQRGLHAVVEPFDMTAGLHHENIFRATNEVGAIRNLLRGARQETKGDDRDAPGA